MTHRQESNFESNERSSGPEGCRGLYVWCSTSKEPWQTSGPWGAWSCPCPHGEVCRHGDCATDGTGDVAGTDDSTDMSETDASDDNDADAADMSSDDSSSDGMNDPSDTEGADDWSAVAGLHRLPRPSGRRYICGVIRGRRGPASRPRQRSVGPDGRPCLLRLCGTWRAGQ